MHVFVQQLADGKVIDHAWRVEQRRASIGHVLEAPYFETNPERDGWWSSVVRFVTRARSETSDLRFNLPFDEHGQDVLQLTAGAFEGLTVARGRIIRLHRGHGPVLRDLWLEDVRLVEMDDFAIVGDDGVVIVACGMAPLVISVPTPCELAEWLGAAHERMAEIAPSSVDRDGHGASVQLAVDDVVEVRGLARPLSTTARTIHFAGWEGDYRTAPPIPDRMIGDEEGTRVVICRIG